MAMTLHIVFGLVAFIGVVLLASVSKETIETLTPKQKSAALLSCVGVMGSTVLGISTRIQNPIWLVLITTLMTIFLFHSFFKPAPSKKNRIAKKM